MPLDSCVTLNLSPNPAGSEKCILFYVFAFLGGGISVTELSVRVICFGKKKSLAPIAQSCATFLGPGSHPQF